MVGLLTVKEQLQTISNVSSVSIWGEKRYSMRLWLDPNKLAGYAFLFFLYIGCTVYVVFVLFVGVLFVLLR